MTYVERTLIVPAESRDLYAQLCELLAGTAGADMFTTALSANGQAPATHFISAGSLDESFVAVMSDPEALLAACGGAGIEATLAECVELLNAARVSEEDAFVAMARLGLRIVEADQGEPAQGSLP